jgi:hypothetical protein
MEINLVVFCYRGSYFYEKYGPAVRDLQILITLAQMEGVSVTLLERPISVYERMLGKFFPAGVLDEYDIRVNDKTSFDVFGPLRLRLWWEGSVKSYLSEALPGLRKEAAVNVFLDFMPIGIPKHETLDGWYYWYDFIDNFTKHNRYSEAERQAVQRKYAFVKDHAQLLTFVSNECLHNVTLDQQFGAKTSVLTNKVFEDSGSIKKNVELIESSKEHFDFGFIGFVTNKIDIEFIKRLAGNFTVAIYGDFYDQKVKARLQSLDNVKLLGGFHYRQLSKICETFKVGLLPYRQEVSHDGSPLKLYEYLRYRKPVLTSIDYELTDEKYIVNYRNGALTDDALEQMIRLSGNEDVAHLLSDDDYFGKPLREIVSSLIGQF